jgi:hypothetical protein
MNPQFSPLLDLGPQSPMAMRRVPEIHCIAASAAPLQAIQSMQNPEVQKT